MMLIFFMLTTLLIAASAEQPQTEKKAVEDDVYDEDLDLDARNDDRTIDEIILSAGRSNGTAFSMDEPHINEDGTIIVQGDMRLTQEQLIGRKILGNNWRNGVVYYQMANHFSRNDRSRIERAMKVWQSKVPCLQFKQRRNEPNYIYIQDGGSRNGCSANVGMIGGKQYLSLHRPGCMTHGVILHEFGHSLGFQHEQCRSDRDQYVKINFNNIEGGPHGRIARVNFGKLWTTNYAPYDYNSLMHYGPYAFSRCYGCVTIQTKDGSNIGQRRGLSYYDVQAMRKKYRC